MSYVDSVTRCLCFGEPRWCSGQAPSPRGAPTLPLDRNRVSVDSSLLTPSYLSANQCKDRLTRNNMIYGPYNVYWNLRCGTIIHKIWIQYNIKRGKDSLNMTGEINKTYCPNATNLGSDEPTNWRSIYYISSLFLSTAVELLVNKELRFPSRHPL